MTELYGYTVHPLADEFPLIEGDEFAGLVDSIAEHGLFDPIVLSHDGQTLIDGRNRLRACYEARTDPRFVNLGDNESEVDYIVAHNLARRDLNPGQRAVLALTVLPHKEAEARRRMSAGAGKVAHQCATFGKAAKQAAEVTGSSTRAVQQAKRVQQHAPELLGEVKAGTVTLKEAEREAAKRQKAKAQPPADSPPKPTPVTVDLIRPDGTTVAYPKPKTSKFNKTETDGISWAAWSWNPVTGCLHDCAYCYARDMATSSRYASAYPVGFDPIFHPERLDAPANTKPGEGADGRVFVCSMADLFGKWVPDKWIDSVLDACKATPEWTYIYLTKFPSRYEGLEFPPNAWVGTSVDTARRARRIGEAMSKVEAQVRWLSIEPLLEPIEFDDLSMYDWIVIGAQTAVTGHKALAPDFEWVADIVRVARRDGCKVHLKPNLRTTPGMVLPDEYP